MSWGPNPRATNRPQYTKSTKTDRLDNKALTHAASIMRSETALTNPNLMADFELILKGGCTYLPNFFCETPDLNIYSALKTELQSNSMVRWSSHFKFEDPDFSSTFNSIIKQMGAHFGVEVLQSRLNYYADGTSFKPFHKDRHAYGEGVNKIREDFTMGASFGAARNLEFQHEESGTKFSFPQNNGDVFAFDSDINKKFLHAIPKVTKKIQPRFSIIAWGRKINK